MAETSPPPRRRFAPQPVETTVKKSRRFAVEPVETTVRSNKKVDTGHEEEASTKSESAAPKRRFLPEPVETSYKSNKKDANPKPLPTPELTPVPIPQNSPPSEAPKVRRKFTPDLIETSKRSKKAEDKTPATLPTDKTDITPGTNHIYSEKKKKTRAQQLRPPSPPANTPEEEQQYADLTNIPPYPPRRQGSMRPHPNTRRSTRQNSFQPELEPIISETSSVESEGSDEEEENDSTPSLSGSVESSEDSMQRLQLARTRESCDDRFSGYLLALAAKAAEKQLREQALAAFPNSDFHEIVEHFYDREVEGASDEDEIEGIGMLPDEPERKVTEVGWAVKEMREHQEKLNRLREDETNKKVAAEATTPSFQDPFWTNGMTAKNAAFPKAKTPLDRQKEAELERMRSAASPPMLGGDLKFRMCPSPKATKFETDQRHDIQPHKADDGGGLWGGYCVAEEVGEYLSPALFKVPPMVQTPNCERDDPFATAFGSEVPGSRPSSMRSSKGIQMLAGLDERLQAEIARSKKEDALMEEFNDTFVTQVYNYLSLGYPALARPYDEELAKISGVPIEELKKDDKSKNAKGHIGAPDKAKLEGKTEYCARWKALRLYILEWARQHPGLETGAMGPSAWGVRARRGSWAI